LIIAGIVGRQSRLSFFLAAAAVAVGALFSVAPAKAVSVSVIPSADTTLIGIAPTNNSGAQGWVQSGRIQINYVNRALFKFDLAWLPTNAIILSAAVALEVVKVPDEPPANSTFGLHRMLRPWGEGNNVAGMFPGQGSPANPGGATYLCAFFPTNNWSAPGALEGVDFSSLESSFQSIAGMGTYHFAFTPELADDVQFWVINPDLNFGWLLKSNSEETIFTARRFASREDPNSPPQLEIEYVVPPRISSAQRAGSQFQLDFTPWVGEGYAVQYRDSLISGSWQTLTNLGIATNAAPLTVFDTAGLPQRFYRVVGY